MDKHLFSIIDSLGRKHTITVDEYEYLITHRSDEGAMLLAARAREIRESLYGRDIFIRGLIEFSNRCKNDCLYCGIRRSNANCTRYRLTEAEIMSCCKSGYDLGFRTFVLQSGEDGYFTDKRLCRLIGCIKKKFPDCAITLSSGERSRESYRLLFEAGAERYLLRHETIDKALYKRLHPAYQSFEKRLECLLTLREIGYTVGCGFMVSPPFQTARHLAQDLKFIELFQPEMCGIGPFIPHKDTPFRNYPAGSVELTCYLMSIIRITVPHVLLPATTALGTLDPAGREKGMLAGANVVMPNLSPENIRDFYKLYDGKICKGSESADRRAEFDARMRKIGYRTVVDRGDIRRKRQ